MSNTEGKAVLRISVEADTALTAEAKRRGVTKGELMSRLVRERIPATAAPLEPFDTDAHAHSPAVAKLREGLS